AGLGGEEQRQMEGGLADEGDLHVDFVLDDAIFLAQVSALARARPDRADRSLDRSAVHNWVRRGPSQGEAWKFTRSTDRASPASGGPAAAGGPGAGGEQEPGLQLLDRLVRQVPAEREQPIRRDLEAARL